MEEKKVFISFSVKNSKISNIHVHLQKETCITHIFANLKDDHYIDLRAKWLLTEEDEDLVDIEDYLIENCFESFFIPSEHDSYDKNSLVCIEITSEPVKHYMQILQDGEELIFMDSKQ